MIKYHVTAGLMVKDIAKLLKYFRRFFTRNVRKDAHLNSNLSQKHFPFFYNFKSPVFFLNL
ncbi:MAG TPA: hypothetical protein VJ440_03790 [Candidatus Brocadiaceae bacterium]|nr:hypothetical protein [Candidatus Brocadiaceae bacterium]